MPQFLTVTLVKITEALLLQKDYFRGHAIWKPLEVELHRRRNNMNNQDLAKVVHALGSTGNATAFFFEDLEETIIDSPIPIENEHLTKMLNGYSLVDQGTPVFYSHCAEVLIHRGLDNLTSFELANICRDFRRATNTPQGAAGFYKAAEKHLSNELH